ncbi:H-NS histone family protein [Chromobacterium violaceum]|uniref:H-NS histone family protein n=1 Tax=Chromobacterium violaceum TaxID=536 RepID=UPI001E31ACA2|nr:H-NS histone family protein [Chromobacterium violaceum]MCD0493834.1 H-NS histone family protein [Chromobacterium violaceum]
MQENQDFRAMTSDTIGKDLLGALVSEIKLLPDVWQKLPQAKQDDVIDRLRKRVESNVKMAIHLLSSEGRVTVPAHLEQFVSKDGVKVQFKVNQNAAGIVDLMRATGKTCLLVVANADENLGGMDDIQGEPDQRAMDLGHEHHDNDGGGMDDIFGGEVVDAEFEEVPQLPVPDDDAPTEEELDKAFDAGYAAAEAGEPESACPVMSGALCIAWVKGWKYSREDSAGDLFNEQSEADAPAVSAVRYRHPEHENQTWTGRGRKPQWVQDWLNAGGTLEELAVNDEAADEAA